MHHGRVRFVNKVFGGITTVKNIVEMIENLNDCIVSIKEADEGSMQYSKALEATGKELQSFLPQSDEEVSSAHARIPIERIKASSKVLMRQHSRIPKFPVTLSLAELLQMLVNQCDISDFSPELKRKLFGERAESI